MRTRPHDGCAVDNCTGNYYAKGMCRSHYQSAYTQGYEPPIYNFKKRQFTRLTFEKLGMKKNVKPIILETGDLHMIHQMIQKIMSDQGFNVGRLMYRWNPNGDGVNYIINDTTMGKATIAVFILEAVAKKSN